jgi:hypothetical protein
MTDSEQFGDELAREHARLEEVLGQADEFLDRPPDDASAESLRPLLAHLEQSCRDHMRYEEAGGYLTPARKRFPHLNSRIDDLRDEHRILLDELDALAQATREGADIQQMQADVLPRLRQWLEKLRHHEHQENELIQETFGRDLGQGG